MRYIKVKFEGDSRDDIDRQVEDFLREYPPARFDTTVHTPAMVGMPGNERWIACGERLSVGG